MSQLAQTNRLVRESIPVLGIMSDASTSPHPALGGNESLIKGLIFRDLEAE